MALNTFKKRYSIMEPVPLPDGSIANMSDRRNLLWLLNSSPGALPSQIKSVSRVLLADIKKIAGVSIASLKKILKVPN